MTGLPYFFRPGTWAFAAAMAATTALAPAHAQGSNSKPNCAAPSELTRLDNQLKRLSRRSAAGQPLTIVAIGSSSTAGVGASDPDNAYPARLEDELQRRWPTADITVLNRGIGGERAHQMLARFERDIFAEKPDLVIWQAGTNGALRGDRVEALRTTILEGVERLRRERIDVVLMSPQYAPSFNRAQRNLLHVEGVRSAGRQTSVAVFRRFEIMQYWLASGQMTLDEMLSPDGLHLNDLSYGCVANQMAALIDHASRPVPMVVAANRLPASVFAGEGPGQ
jgi:acyl-CoA thioesterase-1